MAAICINSLDLLVPLFTCRNLDLFIGEPEDDVPADQTTTTGSEASVQG